MKIMQVLLSPRIGGAETLVETLAMEWESSGHIARTVYVDAATQSNGSYFRVRRLNRSIREMRPDIVVAHSALPNLYARIATPRGIPVISVLHSASDDFADRKLQLAEEVLRHRHGAVVAVSQLQLDTYKARFGSAANISLIPNGVPDNLPRKATYRSMPQVISTVARVVPQKNPELWLRVRDLLDEHLAGAMKWHGPISSAEATLYTPDRGFTGPTAQVGKVLAASDIYFHPASREAHSIGILEAAAVGIPIVCSEEVAATLPPNLAFATFAAGDSSGAAEALTRTVDSYELAARKSSQSADYVRRDFGSSATALTYLRLFDRFSSGPA